VVLRALDRCPDPASREQARIAPGRRPAGADRGRTYLPMYSPRRTRASRSNGHARPNASVDLGEEDRHAAAGESRDVVDRRLPLLGSKASLERGHILERELGDALVGDRAAVRGRNALRSFESLQARDRLCQRRVRLRVVALEGVRIVRASLEHDCLDHGASFRRVIDPTRSGSMTLGGSGGRPGFDHETLCLVLVPLLTAP
jgi:hypothetical protein